MVWSFCITAGGAPGDDASVLDDVGVNGAEDRGRRGVERHLGRPLWHGGGGRDHAGGSAVRRVTQRLTIWQNYHIRAGDLAAEH